MTTENPLTMIFYHDIGSLQVAVALTIVTSLFLLWQRFKSILKQKKPFPGLPMPPDPHVFLGHIPHFRKPFQEFLRIVSVDWANEHGHTGYWIGNRPMMVVTHWEDARKIFLSETHRRRVPIFTKHLEAAAKYNILTLTGREWKVQRTAIARAFQTAYDNQYRSIMVQVVGNLVASLKDRILQSEDKSFCLDMESMMKMVTMDVFGLASMGLDLGCCKSFQPFQFAREADFLNGEILRRGRRPLDPFCYFYSLPCENNRKFHQAKQSIRAYFSQAIEERKRQQANDSSKDNSTDNMDLFARLVKGHALAQKEMPGVVPEDALLDLVLAVMFAGYETTSITLTYAFYLLDKHPSIQDLCLKEIQSLDKLDNPKDLVYCTAVIMETLRLYPAAVITSRTLQKPLELSGGYIASKGTTILLPIWQMNRLDTNWPEPEDFRPDRWARKPRPEDNVANEQQWVEREESDTSGSIAAANRKAFFTFSAGGRSCPGQSFALQESVLVLAGLLKEFRFSTEDPDYVVNPIREGLTQHPKDGMPMKVELRK